MQKTIDLSAADIILLIKEKRIKIGDYTLKPNFSYLSFISLLQEDLNKEYEHTATATIFKPR